jgi:hypothetical protein
MAGDEMPLTSTTPTLTVRWDPANLDLNVSRLKEESRIEKRENRWLRSEKHRLTLKDPRTRGLEHQAEDKVQVKQICLQNPPVAPGK